MLRPACVAEKTPAPSNSVFVDSTRSAAPPTIVGVNGFSACITFRPASRVATSSPAGKTGSASRQPSRGSPRRSSSRSRASSGKAPAQAASRSSHSRCSSAPRSRNDGHVLAHGVGDREGRVGVEAHRLLRRADLGLAERGAVRLGRVDRMRRRIGDVGAEDDQRRPLLLRLRGGERAEERVEVLGVVDVLDVPAVRLEALALVLGRERERRSCRRS